MAVASIGGNVATTTSTTAVATGYTYQRFTSSGTFALPAGYSAGNPLSCDVITVGGGGGGAAQYGGGGGAGDVRITSGVSIGTNIGVTVGAGGSTNSAGGYSLVNFTPTTINYANNPRAKYGNIGGGAYGFTTGGYGTSWYDTSNTQQGAGNVGASAGLFNNGVSPVSGVAGYGAAGASWNDSSAHQMLYTITGLTAGVTYSVSFWYGYGNGGNGGSIASPYVLVDGVNKGAVTLTNNVWQQYTGTFVASSTAANVGFGGTNSGSNTFFVGWALGYIRCVESTVSSPYTFLDGGLGGVYGWAGTAGQSSSISQENNITLALGGGAGANAATASVANTGGSTGGGGAGAGDATVYTAAAVNTPASGVQRNKGGRGLALTKLIATTWVLYRAAGGGGGAGSAGSDGDWQNNAGGSGGLGFDANPWCGSTTTLDANLIGGGGSGGGLQFPGKASHGGGTAAWNSWQTPATTVAAAVAGTNNTGGGGGAQATGGSGLVIIRYKA
jgi:hypothetical protein